MAGSDVRGRALPYLGVFALALGVRALYLLEWSDTPLFSVLMGDGRQYDRWAREILAGDWLGSQVFYQAPFYPYFVATVYASFGAHAWALRGVQIGLGSAACVLLALAGRRFFTRSTGIAGGVLLALYPPALYFDGLVQKAVLGGVWTALLLFLLGEFLARRTGGWLLGAGIALGCFAVTRENALILPPLVAAWLLVHFRGESIGRRLVWVGVLVAGLAAVLVPVGLRNQLVGGQFLLTTSQLGPNFFIGNNPDATGRYVPVRPGRGDPRYERQDATALAEEALGHELTPAEVSSYWLDRSLDYIRSEPGDWLRLLAKKWLLVWHTREVIDTDSIEVHRDESLLLRVLGGVLHFGVLVPLAVLGAWVTRAGWRRLWLLHAVVFGFAASVAAFYVLARYRFPMVPVLALFAGAGALELARRLRSRDPLAVLRAALIAILPALACNWALDPGPDPRAITRYSLGVALVETGRYEQAREQLEQALDLNPDFIGTHLALAEALAGEGRDLDALPHYREATRLPLLAASAHNGMGIALSKLGRTDEAIEHFQRALAAQPRSAEFQTNLGTALVARGRHARALEQLDAALELAPGHVRARYARALALQHLGRVGEAQAEYRRALESATDRSAPPAVASLINLAASLATCDDDGLRNGPEAVARAEEAVRITSGAEPVALDTLAAAYAETGRYRDAAATAERALALARAASAAAAVPGLEARLELYRRNQPYRIRCGPARD